MTSRKRWFYLVVPVLLTLSACSTAGGAGETSSTASGGAIELAVSETCTEGSSPQCISVNGENILLPSEFVRAGVQNAAVAKNGEQSAVDVTFSDDGAAVFHSLTAQAAQAGDAARLVLKIGDEIQTAPRVMAAMEGDSMQFILPPDESAQKIVDLIQRG